MKINGRNNKNYIDLPVDLIIEEYNSGVGLRKLAQKYKVSHETIRKRLKKEKIKLKPKGLPKGTNLVEIDKEKLLEIYNKNHSIAEASKILGISNTKLYSTLRDLNVELVRPDLIKLPIDKIVRDYNLGLTQYELAEKYNVSPMTINRRLKNKNILTRSPGPRLATQKIKAKQKLENIEKFENKIDKESMLILIHDFINSYSKDKKELLTDLKQFLNNLN